MEEVIKYPKGYKTANARLKIARNIVGETQKGFASMLDIEAYNIKDIEIGKSRLPVELAFSIEETFNINARWLLIGDGDIFISKANRIESELYILGEILEAIEDIKLNPKMKDYNINLSFREKKDLILYLFKQEISHENFYTTLDEIKELKYEIARRISNSMFELLKLMNKLQDN